MSGVNKTGVVAACRCRNSGFNCAADSPIKWTVRRVSTREGVPKGKIFYAGNESEWCQSAARPSLIEFKTNQRSPTATVFGTTVGGPAVCPSGPSLENPKGFPRTRFKNKRSTLAVKGPAQVISVDMTAQPCRLMTNLPRSPACPRHQNSLKMARF